MTNPKPGDIVSVRGEEREVLSEVFEAGPNWWRINTLCPNGFTQCVDVDKVEIVSSPTTCDVCNGSGDRKDGACDVCDGVGQVMA